MTQRIPPSCCVAAWTSPWAGRRRRGFLLALLLAAGLATFPPEAAAQQGRSGRLLWAWSGAVTASSAIVKAALSLPSAGARIRLVDEGGARPESRTVPADGFLAPDANGVVQFQLSEMQSATRYRYTVESAEGATLAGSFRTFAIGPLSFKVAFASCASTGSNSRVFDAIRAQAPDLFIHMGDLHYQNIGSNSPDRFRQAYGRVLASPRQSQMYRAMPLVYVWDDHDFGPNDADSTSPSKPAAFSVYQQFVPHYPLGTPDNLSVNQAFTIGRIRFIVTDNRSSRTPSSVVDPSRRTMLGSAQLAWLERELKSAAEGYALVVWVNTVPWITRRRVTADGWELYDQERTRIADLIEALGLSRRMVMLSGDAHMVAIDDGTNSNYATGANGRPAFPVVHAAPMDRATSEKGGPYTNGISRRRGQFGLMEVADDGRSLRLELTGRNITGGVIPRMRLVVACNDDGCSVVESDATD